MRSGPTTRQTLLISPIVTSSDIHSLLPHPFTHLSILVLGTCLVSLVLGTRLVNLVLGTCLVNLVLGTLATVHVKKCTLPLRITPEKESGQMVYKTLVNYALPLTGDTKIVLKTVRPATTIVEAV